MSPLHVRKKAIEMKWGEGGRKQWVWTSEGKEGTIESDASVIMR